MPSTTLTINSQAEFDELCSCAGERLGLRDAGGAIRACTPAEFKNLWLIGQTTLMRREVLAERARRANVIAPDPTIT